MKTCLVNLAYLDPSRIGGVGRIAYEVSNLLANCAEESTELRVIFVVSWRFAGAFAAWLGQVAVVVPYITRYDLQLTLWLLKPDVVISPLFGLEPFTKTSALHIAGMPDALALDHPELFSAADLVYRQQVYAQLKQAFRVVTLSQHARQRLLHHTTLQPEQIAVVGLGADSQVVSQPSSLPDLPARYLYYPANFWPHKRHDLLFRIFGLLHEEQPDIHLVLTGGRTAQERQNLRSLTFRYNCPPNYIRDLGYVDDSQLIALYQNAEALIFVSQYEGFGMPLLEAMLQGCPVICAPLAAIPEVVGEAGIYVDSENADEWVRAITVTLPEQRPKLIALGLERAAHFTWAQTRAGWAEVLTTAGVVCGEGSKTLDKGLTDTSIAVHMLPLLDQVSKIASSASSSRWRRLITLPTLIVLQLRLLWKARHYRYSH